MSAIGHDVKGDGESWEDYARRLERRIKEQRDQLESLNQIHSACGNNRADRKRINNLRFALGKMTERWEKERTNREALVKTVETFRAERVA
jgi:hypothetical protein